MQHCKFRTSYGGVIFCEDAVYLDGFCKFHHQALQNGEINGNGVLSEKLSDQRRRREINYHGIPSKPPAYRDERE